MESDRSWFEDELLARFTRYVKVFTTSDRHSQEVPSTARQLDLARMLADQLSELGVKQVDLDEKGYLVARLPASSEALEKATPIGFMSHVDTSPDSSGENVRPQLHRSYDGGCLRLAEDVVLDPDDYPGLLDYRGETIITSDGSTLLGADDKAGVAEIMTAVAWLQSHPEFASRTGGDHLYAGRGDRPRYGPLPEGEA